MAHAVAGNGGALKRRRIKTQLTGAKRAGPSTRGRDRLVAIVLLKAAEPECNTASAALDAIANDGDS